MIHIKKQKDWRYEFFKSLGGNKGILANSGHDISFFTDISFSHIALNVYHRYKLLTSRMVKKVLLCSWCPALCFAVVAKVSNLI